VLFRSRAADGAVSDLPKAGTVSIAGLAVRFSAALSVLLIGCHDSVGPGNVAGYYELTAVDSLEVPRMVSATTSCDELVLRGLLRSEEHTSELQSLAYLVCRLLLEKKNISFSLNSPS